MLSAVQDRIEGRLRPEDRYAVASHDEVWVLLADVANEAVANTIATGAILVVLISTLGPISGAHFNPAVSLVFALRRELPWAT